MNNQQKVRLGILGVSGLLLGGGILGWVWYKNEKQQEADYDQPTLAPHVRLASQKAKAQAQEADQSKPQSPETGTTAKPIAAEAGKTSPAFPNPRAVKPSVAVNAPTPKAPQAPEAAQAPAKSQPTLPAGSQVAAAPPSPPAQAAKPAVAKAAPAQPAQAVPKPVVAVKPAAPAQSEAKPAAAPAVSKPEEVVSKPAVPATSEETAQRAARKEAGRNDPMQALTALLPFPRTAGGGRGGEGSAPPPPGESKMVNPAENAAVKASARLASANANDLVPPPPPGGAAAGSDDIDGLALPVPPEKPRLSDKLTVLSVMDDHAIVTFPSDIRHKNNWPATITLGTGEQFDAMKILQISSEGVTIEEDGERSLKPIATIK